MCECVRADAAAEFEIQNASKLTQLFWRRRKAREKARNRRRKQRQEEEAGVEQEEQRSKKRGREGAAAEKRSWSSTGRQQMQGRDGQQWEAGNPAAGWTVRQCPAAGHTLAKNALVVAGCLSRCRYHFEELCTKVEGTSFGLRLPLMLLLLANEMKARARVCE